MATFKIKVNPTFRHTVDIPEPGSTQPSKLSLEFKHRTKTELADWASSEETKAKNDLDYLMDFVVSWYDCDQAFSKDALNELIENHLGAAMAIRVAYLTELTGSRLGNFGTSPGS